MATFLVTFLVFSLAAGGLAIGFLLQGRELKGSCGGISAMNGEPCAVCGKQPTDCDRDPPKTAVSAAGTWKPAEKHD